MGCVWGDLAMAKLNLDSPDIMPPIEASKIWRYAENYGRLVVKQNPSIAHLNGSNPITVHIFFACHGIIRYAKKRSFDASLFKLTF